MSDNSVNKESSMPLCVDLDGTLIKTDSLFELFFLLLKKNPFYCFVILFSVFKSKAHFKDRLSDIVSLPIHNLPYNADVIGYIKSQSKDRELILISGANIRIATLIAEHLNLFDDIVASSSNLNMTSHNKRDYLVNRFGKGGYEYIGNERADIPVWAEAGEVSVVSQDNNFLEKIRNSFDIKKEIILEKPSLRDYLKAIRVHQWVKNLLVFVPFILNQKFTDYDTLIQLCIAFLCLSLLASLTYVLNDLLDLESDRLNQHKKKRAFASCLIPIKQAVILIVFLTVCVIGLMTILPVSLIILLLLYLITTLLYSFYLKSVAIMDVIVLAGLFTLRILFGVVAIDTPWSFWLLAFSMFFFLSLAFAKRYSELLNLQNNGQTKAMGRGYFVEDRIMLKIFGISSGFISILVIALYLNSPKVSQMYSHPEVLWLICPLLMYWIARIWLLTGRGHMHEDPIVFAIRDKISIFTGLLCILIVIIAIFARSIWL